MRNIKFMKKLFIVAALMCSAMILAACGNGGSSSGEKEYKVTVKDALGNVYGKGIIVEFYKGDERAGMQVCDENGVAAKTLASDTYTIKIQSSDKAITYTYEEGKEVTGEKTEIDVIVSQMIDAEATTLYVGAEEYDAYNVKAGCTKVELVKGDRNYFLFTPTEAGEYEVSVVCDADTEVGYYGAPHFVQSSSAAEVKDGKFTLNIKQNMIGTGDTGTTVVVIGVDALEDSKEAVLCVNRVGDPKLDESDAPWDIYEATTELSQYTLPEGVTLNAFDVTAAGYTVVFNETDGYYHLNTADGPLIVVYLAKDPEVAYVPCFKTVLDRSGVSKYFYDDNGDFVKKESYSECLLEYIEVADESEGVYPLTEDLKYIIQSRGEYANWWDTENQACIFKDPAGNIISNLNSEIAWLFMCAYIE